MNRTVCGLILCLPMFSFAAEHKKKRTPQATAFRTDVNVMQVKGAPATWLQTLLGGIWVSNFDRCARPKGKVLPGAYGDVSLKLHLSPQGTARGLLLGRSIANPKVRACVKRELLSAPYGRQGNPVEAAIVVQFRRLPVASVFGKGPQLGTDAEDALSHLIPPKKTVKPFIGKVAVFGNLKQAVVQRVLKRKEMKLRRCFALQKCNATVRSRVTQGGKVPMVQIVKSTCPPKILECLLNETRRLRFPKRKTGGLVAVEVPLRVE